MTLFIHHTDLTQFISLEVNGNLSVIKLLYQTTYTRISITNNKYVYII